MKFYEVEPPMMEDLGDGEDRSEWFTSKEAAMKCFNKWVRRIKKDIADKTYEYKTDNVRLYGVTLRKLPPRALLLAVLNRRGWSDGSKVVREWHAPRLGD